MALFEFWKSTGVINPSTREWKDGLFSTIMRDLSNVTHDGPKWIVLDGDIDPMWIESLNTVMDDNKVLTLASNERIPLTPSMRMLFEISHLKAATPATVSRYVVNTVYMSHSLQWKENLIQGWNPVCQPRWSGMESSDFELDWSSRSAVRES